MVDTQVYSYCDIYHNKAHGYKVFNRNKKMQTYLRGMYNQMEEINDVRKKIALLIGRLELDGRFAGLDKSGKFEIGTSNRLEISKEGLWTWRDGGTRKKGWPELSRAVAEEFNMCTKYGKLVNYDMIGSTMGAMNFGERLGLSRQRCRYYIDQIYGRYLPTFQMFSLKKADADEFMRNNGGFYTIYRLQKHPKLNWVVVQIPLSIRHLMSGGKKGAKTDYRVRCKLSVPRVPNKGAKLYEYDGVVASTNEAWYWSFEMRSKERAMRDMIFCTTNTIEHDGDREFFQGHMISSSQVESEAVHWPIVIIKENQYKVKKVNQKFGLYDIVDCTAPDHPDAEKLHFENKCRFIRYSKFDDNWIIKRLVLEHMD